MRLVTALLKRHHLASGGAMIAIRISDYAGRLIENFFVNRMFGTTLLGSYTFGNQVSKVSTEAALDSAPTIARPATAKSA